MITLGIFKNTYYNSRTFERTNIPILREMVTAKQITKCVFLHLNIPNHKSGDHVDVKNLASEHVSPGTDYQHLKTIIN